MKLPKFLLIFASSAALVLSFPAAARLSQFSESLGEMELHALLKISSKQSVLISTSMAKDGSALLLSDFAANGRSRQQRVPLPLTLTGLSSQAVLLQSDVLIAGSDPQGKDHLLLVNWNTRKVSRTTPAPQFTVITALAAATPGFLVGGTSAQESPLALLMDRSLNVAKTIDLAPNRKGEIGGFFQISDKHFAVANFTDATSAIYELAPNGTVRSVFVVPGGAATALVLSDGNVGISYRAGRDAILQILDPSFRVVATTPVLQIRGTTTKTPALVEFRKNIFWIGANEGRLTVQQFALDGKRQGEASRDQKYNVPHRRSYLADVINGRLYIQGQSLAPKDDPAGKRFVEYRFVLDQ